MNVRKARPVKKLVDGKWVDCKMRELIIGDIIKISGRDENDFSPLHGTEQIVTFPPFLTVDDDGYDCWSVIVNDYAEFAVYSQKMIAYHGRDITDLQLIKYAIETWDAEIEGKRK